MKQRQHRSLQMLIVFGGVSFSSEALAQRHLFTELRAPEVLSARELDFFGTANIYAEKPKDETAGDFRLKKVFCGLGIGVGSSVELNLRAGSFDVDDDLDNFDWQTIIFGARHNILTTKNYVLTSGLEYEHRRDLAGDKFIPETDFSVRLNKWSRILGSGTLNFGQEVTRADLALGVGFASKWLNFTLETSLKSHLERWRFKDYDARAGVGLMFVIGPVSLTTGVFTNPNPSRGTFFEVLGTVAVRL